MPDFSNEVAELEAILHDYTVFFIIFDVVFTAVLFLGAVLGIKFIKSRKKLLESNEYLSYTIHGQEEERSHIARELHDTVAQDLRYCKNLSEKADAAEHLKEISALLEKSMLQVRSMSYHLSPPDITKRNFAENLKNLCAEFAENGSVDFRLSILDGTDTSFLTEDDNLHLYRIVQESFTNAVKHAVNGYLFCRRRPFAHQPRNQAASFGA